MNDHELTLRETTRGIAIRAAVIGAGSLILTAVVAAESMRIAGTMMKVAAGTGLLLVGGGMAAWEVRKMKRRLSAPPSRPVLV
jgi:protein-S-isoprenylcysteine O-methyltransferase Ste14